MNPQIVRKFDHLASLVVLAISALSCSSPTEEARIKDFLAETTRLAEKKDLTAVMLRIAEDFRDFEGRDKTATAAVIEDYFGRYRGIVIHLLSVKVDAVDPEGVASVRAEVMVSSGAAEALRKLIRYIGDYYRFSFRLKPAGSKKWLFAYAAWESIPLSELFPESLAILKKLFPGL